MGQGFFGREDELASLMSLFKAAATRGTDGRYGGPRMAFVLAESGVGKSRLVQELYIRLTEDPAWDPPETRTPVCAAAGVTNREPPGHHTLQ